MSQAKQVIYQTTNTYSTLNNLTPDTKNVWIACHGIGFLSKYFISYFKKLDPDENYIIAPQAPSKYYQTKAYRYVGASWLTKENRDLEIENVLNYLDALVQKEEIPEDKTIILMGFSQGVSIVTRWIAYRQMNCDRLVIHSGSIPEEFDFSSFNHLPKLKTTIIYGDQDEYITQDKIDSQIRYAKSVFPNPPDVLKFEGGHEMHVKSLVSLSKLNF
ncbi:alpha/beta hydrolase [Psychroflexus tropicus]|uniref:alpha/beta hydrolase n=1 Tax=Psychroflexus tropicus TaxID=197345 RepID=UPI00036503BD|nr:hypothetical protein [Psychroflexus tropicus]